MENYWSTCNNGQGDYIAALSPEELRQYRIDRKQIDCFSRLAYADLGPHDLLSEDGVREVRARVLSVLRQQRTDLAGQILLAALIHRSAHVWTAKEVEHAQKIITEKLSP
ncbi:MAG: hypothetical protein PHX93_01830 [Candidatus Peribacteraceae bacterium]|jgi:hypothetical protein|nr:hypothetical protein [Candidatus Peribacteraceae bacterium]